jgi:hypothetical protein
MTERFSKRYGCRSASEPDVTVRYDAPDELRNAVVAIAYEAGGTPNKLRALVCGVLRKRPDASNWSEYPNVDNEVRDLLADCEWFHVYDVIEALAESELRAGKDTFNDEMNGFFVENGIGWKIEDGRLEIRGPEVFERTVRNAERHLGDAGLNAAENELQEAVRDLSRRPSPDVTGGIQHSMAALECVMRTVCGDPKATLGELLKRNRERVPRPLDAALEKIWGYASENARHVKEGTPPSIEEAELAVGIVAAAATYLVSKR